MVNEDRRSFIKTASKVVAGTILVTSVPSITNAEEVVRTERFDTKLEYGLFDEFRFRGPNNDNLEVGYSLALEVPQRAGAVQAVVDEVPQAMNPVKPGEATTIDQYFTNGNHKLKINFFDTASESAKKIGDLEEIVIPVITNSKFTKYNADGVVNEGMTYDETRASGLSYRADGVLGRKIIDLRGIIKKEVEKGRKEEEVKAELSKLIKDQLGIDTTDKTWEQPSESHKFSYDGSNVAIGAITIDYNAGSAGGETGQTGIEVSLIKLGDKETRVNLGTHFSRSRGYHDHINESISSVLQKLGKGDYVVEIKLVGSNDNFEPNTAAYIRKVAFNYASGDVAQAPNKEFRDSGLIGKLKE